MIRNTIVPFLTLIFCLLFSSYAYCNDGQETLDVIVNFTVPSDWEEINYYLYTLKDFTKTYNYWREAMSEGHQPWRFDPGKEGQVFLLAVLPATTDNRE